MNFERRTSNHIFVPPKTNLIKFKPTALRKNFLKPYFNTFLIEIREKSD
ncbi:hypothetical protein SAMN05421821_102331 [Mucilaginibacter lappiensis]|uniref:Uncharacterized protein n=1 Tax=Mucilaginibacter lappiensis TaxID=354630 RepID=A0ABR6PF88_9SPHI|nr:hypothetical protein [Mucilaginibacter lappiensis]SIQ38207.1 hypothetical protein SAMN05421821_102331 [Mucilaginibacter lappiensis]